MGLFMDSMSDLRKYNELKRRIISNEELSDNEWELFYELDGKQKESKLKKQSWDNLFLNSMLLPEQKKSVRKKRSPLEELLMFLKPVFSTRYQHAYAGLIIFFFVGFLSYSALIRKPAVDSNSAVLNTGKPIQQLEEEPIKQIKSVKEQNNDLLGYTENIYLEDYISDAVRSSTDNIKMLSPQPSLRYQLKEETSVPTLIFSGTLIRNEDSADNILLKIFSNDNESYSNDVPLFKESIEVQKDTSAFQFTKKVTHPLKKGLYYFTIEDSGSEDILYLNKFYIY